MVSRSIAVVLKLPASDNTSSPNIEKNELPAKSVLSENARVLMSNVRLSDERVLVRKSAPTLISTSQSLIETG